MLARLYYKKVVIRYFVTSNSFLDILLRLKLIKELKKDYSLRDILYFVTCYILIFGSYYSSFLLLLLAFFESSVIIYL